MNRTAMTIAELRKAEREFDATNNEGCEGYNPYRAEIRQRELEAAARRPRTRYDVLRDLNRYDSSIARESGTYNAEKIAALNAELAAMGAAKTDEYAARGWTRETTQERRTEWNNLVKSGLFGNPVDPTKAQAQEEAQGWTMAELKSAVTHYAAV